MPPKQRRGYKGRLALALILLAGAVVLIQTWINLGGTADERLVRYERWARRSMFATGQQLPGTPDLSALSTRLTAQQLTKGAPVFIRIFKREFELELWMQGDGRFKRFATYPICRWSGTLGPKIRQGDAQAPEGFYAVDEKALNPNSRWHRSFNLGFPNAFDRAQGRTGSFIMVHGGCSSIGCFAMTNPVIDEIWSLVNAALNGGQKRFQVQVYPFRMSEQNLQQRTSDPQLPFWQNLKLGHDMFEASSVPPRVSVCGRTYTFEPPGTTLDGSSPIMARCPAGKGSS